jgi:SsrA-binding protein
MPPKSQDKTAKAQAAIKIACENRKAKFDYHVEERFEAGLCLTGSEVKSLRQGKANLTNAYADIRNNEAWLLQAHVAPYEKGGYANHDPVRKRKLLLHRAEIDKLTGKIQAKGMTLVPLKMYFKNGRAKIEIGLAIGKKAHDKRATTKEREVNRELKRALKK